MSPEAKATATVLGILVGIAAVAGVIWLAVNVEWVPRVLFFMFVAAWLGWLWLFLRNVYRSS